MMISKLCWLQSLLLLQSFCLLSMYQPNKIARMQITKKILITHIRNFQYRLTYKTPQGVIIERNLDGSEIHTYPNGKVVKKNPPLIKNDNSTNLDSWSSLPFKK